MPWVAVLEKVRQHESSGELAADLVGQRVANHQRLALNNRGPEDDTLRSFLNVVVSIGCSGWIIFLLLRGSGDIPE